MLCRRRQREAIYLSSGTRPCTDLHGVIIIPYRPYWDSDKITIKASLMFDTMESWRALASH